MLLVAAGATHEMLHQANNNNNAKSADTKKGNPDDGPQSSSESPPPSKPSSTAVPVTNYKQKEKEEDSSSVGGGREQEQDQATSTRTMSREEAIKSFNDSWPDFAAATESQGMYAYSHCAPSSIANLLGPPVKELNFESERKRWEQRRQQARERELAATTTAAAGAATDPGLEWAIATLREDEKFRQDRIRMMERQERWDRGEYSDHHSDGEEATDDARARAKIRNRLRKPGAPAPTIVELAEIVGLRPAPSAATDDGKDAPNAVPDKEQTLLAPLPASDPKEWQKPRKGGKRRSSTDSGSDPHAVIAAHSTSAKRSKAKESTSSRKMKKQKKSSGSGAGSSFMDKLRKKKRPKDHRHQNQDTQTDEEDDEAYPTKPSGKSSTGKSRIFHRTPKRRDENLTQTSIHDMLGRKSS